MIKSLINGESKTITSAAIIVGAASLASRFLGIIRDRILAGQFGAGDSLDTYYAAFRIPDLIFNLLVLGALSAGFIPLFTQYLQKQEKDNAWRLTNEILNILIIGLLVLCGLLFIFAPQLMKLITPGFSPDKMAQTVVLTRIMFLSPLLLGISSVFGGVLQSFRRFLVYSFAPIFYNLGIIFGALVFVPWWGITGLAWGVVLGASLHLLVQIPSCTWLGYRYQLIFNFKDEAIRKIGRIMVPRTLTLAINQLNLVIITIIASTLVAGSLSVFNLANNLQIFPVGIFGISFAIAAFPTLAALALKEDKKEFIHSFSNTTRQILFFIIPASVLLLVLRAQIVRVVLGSGQFTWEDTVLTIDTLAMFTLSLFAQALIPLLIRGYYAFHNSLTPFILGLVSAVMNIVLSLILIKPFEFLGYNFDLGVSGLALAFSLASILNFALLWIGLRIKAGSLDEKNVIWSVFKISLATLAMAIVTQFMKFGIEPYFGTTTFVGIFLQGLISGLVGIAVFIVVGLALKSQEMITFVNSLKKRMFREKENYPKESMDENVEV
ncbi:MAG: murein biosynthesis integral membrane protein MurJ [Candidatus Parcubacteria bacterium]|nr:murein biosynthesis integral membrane protein MurJ [Candidatus Parcubacteria bacterium]